MNFLFKRVLKQMCQIQDHGNLIIRFLQPDQLLLSTKKLRAIAGRTMMLRRYHHLKIYRRFISYMAILSRY